MAGLRVTVSRAVAALTLGAQRLDPRRFVGQPGHPGREAVQEVEHEEAAHLRQRRRQRRRWRQHHLLAAVLDQLVEVCAQLQREAAVAHDHVGFEVERQAQRIEVARANNKTNRTKYRTQQRIGEVVCDALILDEDSRSDTYPYIQIDEDEVDIGHEATVSKIGDEQLFYLMSRGLSESAASAMVVAGFVEPIVKELPLEYSIEMNRLIQIQMEGSVG